MPTCPNTDCLAEAAESQNWCSECGTSLKPVAYAMSEGGPGDSRETPDEEKPPVALEVSVGSTLIPNCPGILTCRLTDAESPVSVLLGISGSVHFRGTQEHTLHVPSGGPSREVRFEFQVPSSGQFLIKLEVDVQGDDEYIGELALDVGAEGTNSPITLTPVGGLGETGNTYQGDRIGDTEIKDVNVTVNVHGQEQNVAAIGIHEFTSIPLTPSEGRKRIHGRRQMRASYRDKPIQFTINVSDGPSKKICIFSQEKIRLGKERHEPDLRLRLTRATDPEGQRWQEISRTHATISFRDDGVEWSDHSSNGTLVGGNWYKAGDVVKLRSGLSLRPADIISMKVAYCGTGNTEPADYLKFSRHVLLEDASDSVGPVESIRLTRNDDLAETEEYVLMQMVSLIGSDAECGIQVTHPSVKRIHARLLNLGGFFWIEPESTETPVVVEGQRVHVDHLAELYPYRDVLIGDVLFEVAELRQHILDCTCDGH